MSDPLFSLEHDLEFEPGYRIKQVVATRFDILESIERGYAEQALPTFTGGPASTLMRRTEDDSNACPHCGHRLAADARIAGGRFKGLELLSVLRGDGGAQEGDQEVHGRKKTGCERLEGGVRLRGQGSPLRVSKQGLLGTIRLFLASSTFYGIN